MFFFFDQHTKAGELLVKKHRADTASGFTLIEVLVVVVMVGIIGAIAAPSWQSFLDRQRMNAARSDLMGVLKNAQEDAQARQQRKQVEFLPATESTPLSVVVRSSFLSSDGVISYASSPGITTVLGNGEVSSKFQILASTPIVFDHDGQVDVATPYVIKIINSDSPTPQDGQSSLQSCVVVTTLLGGLKAANDDLCDNF